MLYNAMAKLIRVPDDVYEKLQKIQAPRESYGKLIDRLIFVYHDCSDPRKKDYYRKSEGL
jgi:predicted CopG family antitoxin